MNPHQPGLNHTLKGWFGIASREKYFGDLVRDTGDGGDVMERKGSQSGHGGGGGGGGFLCRSIVNDSARLRA